MNASISPILYRIVVPLTRRNAQPVFNRRSFCNTFTLHPRIAAYTCSSTHAQGTAGTRVRSTTLETRLIRPALMSRTIRGVGSPEVAASFAMKAWVVRCRSGTGIAFSESPTTMSASRSICCLARLLGGFVPLGDYIRQDKGNRPAILPTSRADLSQFD